MFAVVDTASGKVFRAFRAQGLPDPQPTGATGLCWWKGKVCVGLQGGAPKGNFVPDRFAILDPNRDFKLESWGELPPGSDVHSVASDGRDLYFAATGRDSVYRAAAKGSGWSVSRHWTLTGSSGERDESHLNGLCFAGENLCVSGYEHDQKWRGSGKAWKEAQRGFLYDITAGKYLMRGINHPHSPLYDGRLGVLACESRENRIVSASGEVAAFPSTYLRGLSSDRDYLYAGSSKRRRFSRSESGENSRKSYEGICGIYRTPRDGREPEMAADLSEHANEIFDLLPL